MFEDIDTAHTWVTGPIGASSIDSVGELARTALSAETRRLMPQWARHEEGAQTSEKSLMDSAPALRPAQ